VLLPHRLIYITSILRPNNAQEFIKKPTKKPVQAIEQFEDYDPDEEWEAEIFDVKG
jgi:hypothetical protein